VSYATACARHSSRKALPSLSASMRSGPAPDLHDERIWAVLSDQSVDTGAHPQPSPIGLQRSLLLSEETGTALGASQRFGSSRRPCIPV